MSEQANLPKTGASGPKLADLLGWLQEVIVHPAGVHHGLSSPEARRYLEVSEERVGEHVLPSSTLTAVERINVYAGMYPLRMREALSVDYPVIKHHLGHHLWEDLVDAYVQVHPSRHPNLNHLGVHMPQFLRRLGTEIKLNPQSSLNGLKDRAFLAELADLELSMTQVFDGPESPKVQVKDLVDLPPEQWAEAIFRPVECFRLHAFNYPVNAYLQAVKEEKDPPAVRRSQTYVAVYRKEYVVWRMGLTRPQYRILKLLTEGRPVAEALYKGAKGGGTDIAGMAAQLRTWFSTWVGEGWFSEIVVPEPEVPGVAGE